MEELEKAVTPERFAQLERLVEGQVAGQMEEATAVGRSSRHMNPQAGGKQKGKKKK